MDLLDHPAGTYWCERCAWPRPFHLTELVAAGERLMTCEVCGSRQVAEEALLDAE